MAMINEKIQLDFTEEGLREKIEVVQGDTGRVLICNIIGVDMTNVSARFYAVKNSGKEIYNNCTVFQNTVTIELTEQTLAEVGIVKCQLDLRKGNQKVQSFIFDINVTASLMAQSEYLSSSEYKVVDDLADKVEKNENKIAELDDKKANKDDYGSPLQAKTVAEMTDKKKVYVYVGTETGYINGNWYTWEETAWVSGGVYNSAAIQTDKTLTQSDKAADSAIVGQQIGSLKESLKDVELKDGGVTTAKIADKAVTADKLGDDVTAKISSDQWQDLETDEVFTIGNPDIDFTEDNLVGWFDFSQYEDGYTGEIKDKYGQMTCTLNDIDKGNEYVGFIDKSLKIGRLLNGVGGTVANIYPKFYSTDQEKVFRDYPCSIEFYASLFAGFAWSSATNGAISSEFAAFSNSNKNIILSTRGATSGGKDLSIQQINDNDTILRTLSGAGQGETTYTLPYKLEVETSSNNPNKYYHFVLCLDQKFQKLYVNGKIIGSLEAQNNYLSSVANTVYAYLAQPVRSIKTVRFYKSVLTDEKVALNYQKTVAKYGGGNQ